MLRRDRRRRLAPPLLVTAVAIGFLLLPVANYVAHAIARGIPLGAVGRVIATFSGVAKVLWLTPIVVGIGLFTVSRWGYWAFLAYGVALVLYDAILLVRAPSVFNFGAIVQTVLVLGALTYFLRRDIYEPFLAPERRGFRRHARQRVALTGRIDGVERRLVDLSAGGCLVEWPDCSRLPGGSVQLDLTFDEETLSLSCGVVRIDGNRVGLAFRNTDPDLRRRLRTMLRTLNDRR